MAKKDQRKRDKQHKDGEAHANPREDEAKRLVKRVTKMSCAITKYDCVPENCKTTDGKPLTLEFPWATHMSDDLSGWVFNLFDRNMREMYNLSLDGYDPVKKKQELFAATSRYILVKDPTGGEDGQGEYAGYCHFRYVMDHGIAVVYCYELQIEPEYQNKGIGSIVLGILDKLSSRAGFEKIVATVFAYNGNSLSFFHKLGYKDDVTSPTPEDDLDYLILSKPTPPETP